MGERIIETWIQAKHPNQELCEDGLYTGRNYYAVIDGVTSKGSLVWPGEKTGGRFAKDVLLEALDTLPADMNAEGAVSYLNGVLREASFQAAENPEVLERVREERPQAVLIAYSRMRREVWCFGDCQCMIGGRLYRKTTVMDELTAGVRSAYNQLELAAGKTLEELAEHDTGREYIRFWLESVSLPMVTGSIPTTCWMVFPSMKNTPRCIRSGQEKRWCWRATDTRSFSGILRRAKPSSGR